MTSRLERWNNKELFLSIKLERNPSTEVISVTLCNVHHYCSDLHISHYPYATGMISGVNTIVLYEEKYMISVE
jgi:hypothetical protein